MWDFAIRVISTQIHKWTKANCTITSSSSFSFFLGVPRFSDTCFMTPILYIYIYIYTIYCTLRILLGSKELEINVLELQCIMLANHNQNV